MSEDSQGRNDTHLDSMDFRLTLLKSFENFAPLRLEMLDRT